MANTKEKEKKKLRQFLSPAIVGPNTDAILEALATGSSHLIDNVEAVNDSLYIVTATGRYLDARLADRDITRPENVGLSDDIFRKIGIEISTRKQIRDLILSLLEIMYGEEFTRATTNSNYFENYQLENEDDLKIQFDDGDILEIIFKDSQFANIASATAQEVADVITKQIRSLGKKGSAFSKNDGIGGYVVLMSQTIGPSSSVKVVGGKAQNKLRFDKIRPTTGLESTEWTVEAKSGGVIRMTWSGGANPSVGKVKKGDYVNIYGVNFNPKNRGNFVITKAQGGLLNNAYVEFENFNGITELTAITQGNTEAVLFFNPTRSTLINKTTFAAAYQTESRLLEVFIPATTKVIRRDRIGSAHLHESGSSGTESGPYIFDNSKGFVIGSEECNTTQIVDSSSNIVINVDNSSDIKDNAGYLVFGFGTSKEEVVPYIARPSSSSLMINPSYNFKYSHESGTNISLVAQNYVYDLKADGTDFAFYITDIVSGRIYTEDLIKLVVATGIKLVITVLYPNDIGLGKSGTENSEKYYVFGADPT